MRLIRKHLELGATKFFIQTGHHQTAIEAAIHLVKEGSARSHSRSEHDLLTSMVDDQQWVVDTIYQGAYMREYHLWEKSCREYFPQMGVEFKVPKHVAFPDYIKSILLSNLDLTVPDNVMVQLSTMRRKVNRMKHESGDQLEEYISADDYNSAVSAIERFWEFLVDNEHVS